MNNTTLSMAAVIFVKVIDSVASDKCPGMGLLGHVDTLVFQY